MKKKMFLAGLISIMLIFGFMVISCSNGTTYKIPEKPAPKTVTIKYQLTGTLETANSVSYTNSTGGDDRLGTVPLPWEETFSVTIEGGKYFHAYISGSSNTGGSLTAKVFVNGTEKETKTSSGSGYFSVSASELISNY
jgi:hypothetical protein